MADIKVAKKEQIWRKWFVGLCKVQFSVEELKYKIDLQPGSAISLQYIVKCIPCWKIQLKWLDVK